MDKQDLMGASADAPHSFRFRIKAGRAKSDPEKLVTPGVLYTSRRSGNVTVHLVAVGWWDWHITALFTRIRAELPQSTPSQEQE